MKTGASPAVFLRRKRRVKKTMLKIVLVLAPIAVAGCKGEGASIEGSWTIDLEPMIQQANSLGASSTDIQQVKETFIDGKMSIDSHRITLTIPGIKGSEIFEYKVSSKEGQCLDLAINASTHKYCTDGKRLEVHDPSTRLIAIYRKS
jgi:hypothetical protein